MISIQNENLIPLRDAPRHLPRRPNGKNIHVSAVYRWIKNGLSGVKLESLRVGGTTYTSMEALQRFALKLSPCVSSKPIQPRKSARSSLTSRALEIELGFESNTLNRD